MGNQPPSGIWWNEPDERVKAQLITQSVNNLRRLQTSRDEDALIFLRMYGGKEAVSYYMGVAMGVGAYTNSASEPMHGPRLNVTQMCVDTVQAKLALSQIKSTFLTNGGDFSAQQRARKLERFCDGIFYQTKQQQLSPKVLKDTLVLGTGIEHIYAENGRICHEKVSPQEITIDEVEGIYSEPRNFYRTKMVQKDVLAQMFPEYSDDIWSMKGQSFENGSSVSVINMVPVTASWHLSSTVDTELAADGQYCLAVNDICLDWKKWKRPSSPFVFLRWSDRSMGFWGQGLAEQLVGIQVELNNVTRTISDIIRIAAVPKMYVETGSKVQVSQLDRTIGAVVYYQGTAPVFRTNPEVVGPELSAREEYLFNKAFVISGVSQLSSSSQLPAGLKQASGKALETFADIETERFSVAAKAYQQFHIDVSMQDIELARELYQDGHTIKASVPGKQFLDTIDFGDCNLERDEFSIQPWPTNYLADDPSDRMKQVQDMAAAGWINQDMAIDLMDFPDLRSYLNLRNAGVETIKFIIAEILDGGRYIQPEPYFNLDLGIQMMESVYGTLVQQSAPEKKMELVRTWIDAAQQMKAQAQAAAMATQGGPPTAQGAPAPTSPLLPTKAPMQQAA